MADITLAKMAKETIQISKQGFYGRDGEKIELSNKNGYCSFSDVIVLDERKLTAIENDEDNFSEKNFYGTSGANIYLIDADSY